MWLLQEESCWQGDHLRTSETMWKDGDRSQQAWKSGAKQEVEMADHEEAQEMGDLWMMGSSGLQHPFSYKYPGQKTGCCSAPPPASTQMSKDCPPNLLYLYTIQSHLNSSASKLPWPSPHLLGPIIISRVFVYYWDQTRAFSTSHTSRCLFTEGPDPSLLPCTP